MEGCFEEFEMSMGYRMMLKTATLDTVVSRSTLMPIRIDLTNVGWAPVYNHKNTSIVFKPESGGEAIEIALDFDIRMVRPNEEFIIEEELDLSGFSPGKYSLHLKIADQFESLKDRPEYCIQLANIGVWDEITGWNSLMQSIEIN